MGSIAIWLPNTARHKMLTFGGQRVKAQLSHLFVCEKHNSQMNLYVQKWEPVKVYFKVIKFEVIRFPRLQSLHCFCVPAI